MPDPVAGLIDTGWGGLLGLLAAGREVPEPFARGTHGLWTDPRVAPQLLAAHLDPSHDRASRCPETIDATVSWLSTMLRPGARVLDLGCGPGLYTERLAAAGFEVTGVDFAPASIAHARSRGSRVRYLLGDYRTVELDRTFDAVILVYLDLGTFSPTDAGAILRRVRHWLAPGGLFVADVGTATLREGSETRRDWGVSDGGFWAPEPHSHLSRTLRYDEGPTYLDEHLVITAHDVRVYRVWERCFTPERLRAELGAAGLTPRSLHADLTGTPYQPSSPVIGFVAVPA